MNWCEVSAVVPVELAELAAEAMRTVAPGGVAIEDPLIPLGPEEGVRLDRRKPSVVKAYLPVDDGLGERLHRLDVALERFGLRPELGTRTVREEDWAHAWKEHFQVEHLGERTVIRPSWRAYTPRPGEVVIDLDPGMAFGTGQHPTTRMCLVLLEQVVQPGISVLDVGTGSGILAIAAIKLGAARCLALDIEPQAVQVARANAIRNSVADRIEVREGTLGLPRSRHPLLPRGGRGNKGTATSSLPLWEGGVGGSGADLVVANITAAAVAGMASAFARALRLGGRLIGSGIIGERLGEVVDALHAAGFTIDEVREEGDWRALLATSTRDEPTPH